MSLAQLFFGKKNEIGLIEFDVTISESATSTATATKNPVENGADITDHVRMEAMAFTVSGVVSDTPVQYLAGLSAQAIENIASGNISGNRPSTDAWDKLLELQTTREPFTLVQGLKSYDNVVITKLSSTQDAASGNALFFTAEMQEIILVGEAELTGDSFNEIFITAGMLETFNAGLKDK